MVKSSQNHADFDADTHYHVFCEMMDRRNDITILKKEIKT